jgi:hypothetical protein
LPSTYKTESEAISIQLFCRRSRRARSAGDSLQALELKIEVVNGLWERSPEREVARDAFSRRIRGKDFNPIRYLDPLTSDRGAALARIMQADKPALEALVSDPAKPKEFVIELTGDYDIIRVIRD